MLQNPQYSKLQAEQWKNSEVLSIMSSELQKEQRENSRDIVVLLWL